MLLMISENYGDQEIRGVVFQGGHSCLVLADVMKLGLLMNFHHLPYWNMDFANGEKGRLVSMELVSDEIWTKFQGQYNKRGFVVACHFFAWLMAKYRYTALDAEDFIESMFGTVAQA